MDMKFETLDSWRDFFKTSNTDIFDIIEHAIKVAASDCPKEFRNRRDKIAEILFSVKMIKCVGCDHVELFSPGDEEKEEFGGRKESKVVDNSENNNDNSNDSNNRDGDQVEEMNMNQVSNYSYGDAEALSDEIEEMGQIVGEVLRIKEILDNSPDETDSALFESLRKLELLDLSVDTLRSTEIGKSVNVLRKHINKDIRQLARTLIDLWKVMVDDWVSATAAIAEATPESVNPSTVDDEEGLPSPPMDDLALFAQPTGIQLSQFFDGIDDDGNPRNSGEFDKNCDSGRKVPKASASLTKRKPQFYQEPYVPEMVNKVTEDEKRESVMEKQPNSEKINKPLITVSGPGRPTKLSSEHKVVTGAKFQQKTEKPAVQRKPLIAQGDDHAARLEASKRKLHERYQEAQNAKRQRTIQVMELHDLPKQGLNHKAQHMRPGNHNRNRLNGRR